MSYIKICGIDLTRALILPLRVSRVLGSTLLGLHQPFNIHLYPSPDLCDCHPGHGGNVFAVNESQAF